MASTSKSHWGRFAAEYGRRPDAALVGITYPKEKGFHVKSAVFAG